MLIGFALETNPSDLSGSVGFTDTKKSFTVRMKPDGGSKTDIKSHMMILQFFSPHPIHSNIFNSSALNQLVLFLYFYILYLYVVF